MDVICGEIKPGGRFPQGGGFLRGEVSSLFLPFRLQVEAVGRVFFISTNCHNISSSLQGAATGSPQRKSIPWRGYRVLTFAIALSQPG